MTLGNHSRNHSSNPPRNHLHCVVGLFLLCIVGCAGVPKPPSFEVAYGQVVDQFETMRQEANSGEVSKIRWKEDGSALMFTQAGESNRMDLSTHERTIISGNYDGLPSANAPRRFARNPGRGRQRDTEPSSDGRWIARCVDWNVVLEDTDSGEVKQITSGGSRKMRFGKASWVYGEELGQQQAMWWSPDSRFLAFYRFDEREVKDFYITGGLTKRRTTVLTEGYPKSGDPNPVATIRVYEPHTGKMIEVETGEDAEAYIYNVQFSPDGSELLFSRTNRHQDRLEVLAADPETGRVRLVVAEAQDTWQENRPAMHFLEDGKRFIWETEKTGWKQYELRSMEGGLICTLTRGDFPIRGIEFVDEDGGFLYYTAYSDTNPLNVQLHRVRLDGTGQERLTGEPLNHRVMISPDGRWFVSQAEATDTPPTTALYSNDGRRVATLGESDESSGTDRAELFTYTADDGETDLYGVLYKPTDFDPTGKYPLIIDVYGGPSVQRVRNTWRAGNPNCEMGFLIAVIDNRGTTNRGKHFEGATYLKLGSVDIQDQVDGVKFLTQRPYVDGDRVGIVGHSYGGYMSALAILKYPKVFQVSVARAAVTDWRNYDTIYTERYMRTPEENPEGYDAGSCLTYADQLEGDLLIMHGMVDDNVHPNNAWQLIGALDKAGKAYSSRFFPTRKHGFDGRDTQWAFLYRHLIEDQATVSR